MKYLLRKVVLDKVPEIEITAEEYAEFDKARNILSNAFAIEEKYEIVIANYLDFEKQILNTTTGYMVREHLDYSDFFEVRLGLNIRLVKPTYTSPAVCGSAKTKYSGMCPRCV